MKKVLKITGITVLLFIIVFLSLPSNHYIVGALLFQQVDIDDYHIFKNRTVRTGEVMDWKIDSNYNKHSISQEDYKVFTDLKTVAYLVIKDSAIIYEQYWENYSDTSLSNSFSVAKSIISLFVGIAVDEGKIKSIDDPVCNYLPEFCSDENKVLTIHHLLTMSSGLNWDESYSSLFSKTTQAYYGSNLRDLVLKLKVVEKPGEKFKYLSCNTQLLALIIEKATGKNVSEYASEKLWKPIGASHDAIWSIDTKNGVEKAYCCFNTNARDFARLGQLILNKGRWGNRQVVSEKYIAEATTPADYLKDEDGSPLRKYGFQWWILNYKEYNVVYARGVNGQYVFVIPSENMVVVRLGHKRNRETGTAYPKDIDTWLGVALGIIGK
jgi:CubicO group peptidase (beta-lactamase class C family)